MESLFIDYIYIYDFWYIYIESIRLIWLKSLHYYYSSFYDWDLGFIWASFFLFQCCPSKYMICSHPWHQSCSSALSSVRIFFQTFLYLLFLTVNFSGRFITHFSVLWQTLNIFIIPSHRHGPVLNSEFLAPFYDRLDSKPEVHLSFFQTCHQLADLRPTQMWLGLSIIYKVRHDIALESYVRAWLMVFSEVFSEFLNFLFRFVCANRLHKSRQLWCKFQSLYFIQRFISEICSIKHVYMCQFHL